MLEPGLRRRRQRREMPCYEPLKAYQHKTGKMIFKNAEFITKHSKEILLKLPCGQCIGCRLDRKREWAIRCMHESQMHDDNCFITLTYDDKHIPADHGLDKKHWQKFAKRLRKKHGPFRYMHCGEYGEEKARPHYHALLFGIDFKDTIPLDRKEGQHPLRISESLAKIWPWGFHSIGQVTFDSAAYVASYCVKKYTGEKAKTAYERVDPETGECWNVIPEYATMSRNEGLGSTWFEKYHGDVYPDNFVVMNGQKWKPPTYYDERLAKMDPELHTKMLEQRKNEIKENAWNYTPERLQVKKKILLKKISQPLSKHSQRL